jgi:hypothetical protein
MDDLELLLQEQGLLVGGAVQAETDAEFDTRLLQGVPDATLLLKARFGLDCLRLISLFSVNTSFLTCVYVQESCSVSCLQCTLAID